MHSTVRTLPLITRDALINAMESGVSGVYIIATDGAGGKAGGTISSLTFVSVEQRLLMICLHRDSPLCPAIEQNSGFSINMLSEGQKPLAQNFATASRHAQAFDPAHWSESAGGHPLLHGAVANFDCQLVNQLVLNSYVILVGEVNAVHRHPGVPLARQARQYVLIQRDPA
ncbi:flavin reductase [Erwinia endophytica]|uniref:flavin reductase family protein n=1 Tax=Erwinia endophytica TaxID=1563158 RepID=UPI001265E5A8|nr:flavin reductase family protein [Erwinia endophytica]KAB8312493.1 flavin reductase [Erwinia endophytica]